MINLKIMKVKKNHLSIVIFCICALVWKCISSTCPIRIPGNCTLTLQPVWGEKPVYFHVPFKYYAFGVAHVMKWSNEAADLGYSARIPATFFLSTTLTESYIGCSNKLKQPDLTQPGQIFNRNASYGDGCYQIYESSTWVEIKRIYPNDFAAGVGHNEIISALNQDTLGRDNFVGSTFVQLYMHILTYSLMYNIYNVNAVDWSANNTADPYALIKLFGINNSQGTWCADLKSIFANCTNKPIENCTSVRPLQPTFIGGYMKNFDDCLDAGNVYNENITVDDVQEYVKNIGFAFVSTATGTALNDAAVKAFNCVANGKASVPFQDVAAAILDAMDAVIKERPKMTDDILSKQYVPGYKVPKGVQVNKYPCPAATPACQNASATTAANTTNVAANNSSNNSMINNTASNGSTVNTQIQNSSTDTSTSTANSGGGTSWALIILCAGAGLLGAAAIAALTYFGIKKYRSNQFAKRRSSTYNTSNQTYRTSQQSQYSSENVSSEHTEYHTDYYTNN